MFRVDNTKIIHFLTQLVYADGEHEQVESIVGFGDHDGLVANSVAEALQQEARLQAKAEIQAFHAEALNRLSGKKSVEERDTWAQKEAAARAYLAKSSRALQTNAIEREATARGLDAVAFAKFVLYKAEWLVFVASVAAELKITADTAVLSVAPENMKDVIGAAKTEAEARIADVAAIGRVAEYVLATNSDLTDASTVSAAMNEPVTAEQINMAGSIIASALGES